MKIQLSPRRIIKDVMTVWYEPGPEVDVVMDLKNLTFADNSIDAIYSFHVLGSCFDKEINQALFNWRKLLKLGSELYVVVDDIDFLARSLVGGDINVDMFNANHSRPSYFTRDSIIKSLNSVGFLSDNVRLWYVDVPDLFMKQPFELVISAKK